MRLHKQIIGLTQRETVSGEVICSECGLVISDIIQESRADRSACFTTHEIYDKSWNAGLPNSLARHDMGLSTIIGIEPYLY